MRLNLLKASIALLISSSLLSYREFIFLIRFLFLSCKYLNKDSNPFSLNNVSFLSIISLNPLFILTYSMNPLSITLLMSY